MNLIQGEGGEGREGRREGGMTVIHILIEVCSIAIQWHHSI